jgi:hypothetical protein
MFLNLPNVRNAFQPPGVVFAGSSLGGIEHPFFDILSQGLTRAGGVMYQESSGREGIEMREVR